MTAKSYEGEVVVGQCPECGNVANIPRKDFSDSKGACTRCKRLVDWWVLFDGPVRVV